MAKLVNIEHRDGRRYQVSVGDFHRKRIADGKTYDDLGFKIVSYDDGSEYVPPEKVEAARVAEAAKRAEG